MTQDTNEFVSITEACEIIGCAPSRIRGLIKEDKLHRFPNLADKRYTLLKRSEVEDVARQSRRTFRAA